MRNYRVLILSLLGAFLFFANLDGNMIYILDEAKNAGCAREMLEQGDWIVPTFNYELRTDKPPLHYFFMMLGYQIFGVGEFGARFFSALFGLATCLITYLFCRRVFDKKKNTDIAFWATLTLITSLQVIIQFHLATPDPYLIFFITATLYSFYIAITEQRKSFLYLAYLCMGMGVLAKGPIAIVIPSGVAFFFLIFTKRFTWKNIVALQPLLGLIIILTLSLPWYLAVHYKTDGAWTHGFFIEHNFQRFTAEKESHGGPFFLPALFVFTGLMPFSVFSIQALRKAWNSKNEAFILCLLTVGLFVLFFAVSRTKLPSYTAPCLPFMAIILGNYLHQLTESIRLKISDKISIGVFSLLAIGIPVGVFIAMKSENYLAHLDFLGFYFIPLILIGGTSIYLFRKQKIDNALYSMGLTFAIASFIFFHFALPTLDKENPVAGAIPLMQNYDNSEIISYKRFNPSFSYYVRKPITKYNDLSKLKEKINESEKEFYVLSVTDYADELLKMEGVSEVFRKKDLFERKTSIVIKVDPIALKAKKLGNQEIKQFREQNK